MAEIFHPGLNRTVSVPDRTVRIWERSGWKRVKKQSRRQRAVELPAADPAEAQPTPTTED